MNPFRSLFLTLSRMPPVLMLFVILGLAVVVTMLVMHQITEGDRKVAALTAAQEAAANQKVKVVYSTKDIEEGEMISREALEERDVESVKAPVDALASAASVEGNIAAYAIPAGTVLSTHALKPKGLSLNFEGKIREGMRALTFAVDNNSGVAGFIAPGSHVDVLGITGSGAETKAEAVMSDVEVIAVGTTYTKAPGQSSANPAGSVTVTLAPDDAKKLVKAIVASKLYLTLRNDRDHTPVAVVDVNALFPKQKTVIANLDTGMVPPPDFRNIKVDEPSMTVAPTAPIPAPMHEIESWSGSKKDVLSVPQG